MPFALFKIILQKLTKSPLAMVYFQSKQNDRLLHNMSKIASSTRYSDNGMLGPNTFAVQDCIC